MRHDLLLDHAMAGLKPSIAEPLSNGQATIAALADWFSRRGHPVTVVDHGCAAMVTTPIGIVAVSAAVVLDLLMIRAEVAIPGDHWLDPSRSEVVRLATMLAAQYDHVSFAAIDGDRCWFSGAVVALRCTDPDVMVDSIVAAYLPAAALGAALDATVETEPNHERFWLGYEERLSLRQPLQWLIPHRFARCGYSEVITAAQANLHSNSRMGA